MELTLIFLRETPPRGICFRVPGAFHHARWMLKLLNVLKLCLFQDQFHLSKHECTACSEFSLFVTLVYVKAWMSCTSSCDAPANDLGLIQQLANYRTTLQAVADTGLRALGRHLWYLGQELVPLAMFSDAVPTETRSRMASHLLNSEHLKQTAERSVKYTGKVDDLSDKTLHYFIGPASEFFFHALHIDMTFLSVSAEQWPEQNS